MAKTDRPGFVENHIEKLVLVLAAVGLVVVLASRVFTSPNQTKIGRTFAPVAPNEIDQKLEQEAQNAQKTIEDRKVQKSDIPPWQRMLVTKMATPFPADWRNFGLLTMSQPPLEQVDDDIQMGKVPPLPPLPPLKQIRVRAESELIALPGRSGQVAKDVGAVHVTAVLDYGTLVDQWRKLLEKRGILVQPTFLRVTAQRQELNDDGSWGEAVTVAGTRDAGGGRGLGRGAMLPEPPDPAVEDAAMVERKLQAFQQVGAQEAIIQPAYYSVYWPSAKAWGGWRHHLPRTDVNELETADIPPDQMPPEAGRASYRPAATGRPTAIPRGTLAPGMPPGPGILVPGIAPGLALPPPGLAIPPGGSGRPTRTPRRPTVRRPRARPTGGVGLAPGMPGGGRPGGGTTMAPAVRRESPEERNRRRAQRLVELGGRLLQSGNVDSAVKKYRAAIRLDPSSSGAQQGLDQAMTAKRRADLPQVTPVPSLANQCTAGIVQVWLHDTTCPPNRTFRYRVRIEVLNPLFGRAAAVEKPDDAKTLVLTAESPWSEPVTIKPPLEYFLVDASEKTGRIKFDIYRMSLGQWLHHRGSFTLGDRLGETKTVQLLNPLDDETSEEQVAFDTGCILVDCDFDKNVGGGGIGRKSIEVTLLTPEGDLVIRDQQTDKKSKQHRELQDEADAAAEQVKRAVVRR